MKLVRFNKQSNVLFSELKIFRYMNRKSKSYRDSTIFPFWKQCYLLKEDRYYALDWADYETYGDY
jgi:hypothetical protein